jgi:predicted transcriptional regulator
MEIFSLCDLGLITTSAEGESILLRSHFSNKIRAPPLAPVDLANRAMIPFATLFTILLAHNPRRIHMQALLVWMHISLGVRPTVHWLS